MVVTIIEENKKQQTMVVDPSPTISETELLRFESGLNRPIEKSDFIIIGGSLPKDIPNDFYARLIKKVKRKGKRVALDSRGDPFFEAIKEKPYMVKFDCGQIEQHTGINKPLLDQALDFAWQLHLEGIDIVIVSMEEKGTIIA